MDNIKANVVELTRDVLLEKREGVSEFKADNIQDCRTSTPAMYSCRSSSAEKKEEQR